MGARKKVRVRVGKARRKKPRANPRERLIYDEVLEVIAKKGPGHLNCDPACKRANHTYSHKFSTRPKLYGSADRMALIIRH